MTGSHSSWTGAPQATPQDLQALASLLGNLMPLIHRMQSPGMGQSPESAAGNFTASNPMLDHQAAVQMVEDITAGSLQRFSAYLERFAPEHPELEGCVAIVTQAAQSVGIRDYARAFDLIAQAYRFITWSRAANPQLPSLRDIDSASAASHSGAQLH